MKNMKKVIFCMGTILVAAFQLTHAQHDAGLCDGWRMENGAGYNSHPTDCDKYVQCRYDGSGVLMGQVQQCAFSTFWSMDLLTCLPVTETKCPHDKCVGQMDETIFGAEGNCRGYWQCAGEQSVPLCCPVGQKYDDVLGCIDNVDKECTDTCFNDNSTLEEAPVCNDTRAAVEQGMFEQNVEGWGWVKMHCAPGTTFIQKLCRCDDHTAVNGQKLACTAEVHLPFTYDHRDESGRGNYVANENVEVINGVAKFNGVNSRLIIPRFTNLEHSSTVVIKARYSSNHTAIPSSGFARTIVSNGACGNVPSIMISEDAANIYFGVGTSDTKFAYTYVPQLDIDMKDVVYTFDNGAMMGSNVVNLDSVQATGYLRNMQCALHIGDGQNLSLFEGEIDELTVYLCNPDNSMP